LFEPSAIVAAPYDGQAFETSRRGMLPVGIGSLVVLGLPEVLRRFGVFELVPGSIWLPLGLACTGCVLFAMCIYAYLSPVTLIIDRSGFRMTGAFTGPNDRQPWTDIDRFSLVTTDSGSRIACGLRPGSGRTFRSGENVPGFGWVVRGFKPDNPEEAVAALNAAVAGTQGQSPTAQVPSDHRPENPDAWIEPQTIEGSRFRYFYSFAGWAFAILAVRFMHRSDGLLPTLVLLATLSPVLVRLLWLGIYPPALTLDAEGVTVPGMLPGRSKTLMWADLQDFVVVLPRRGILDGPRRIGYFLRPGHEPAFSAFDMGTWFNKKVIPSFYTLNTEDVVARLNDCRQRACSR